jgi:hypothetical protein
MPISGIMPHRTRLPRILNPVSGHNTANPQMAVSARGVSGLSGYLLQYTTARLPGIPLGDRLVQDVSAPKPQWSAAHRPATFPNRIEPNLTVANRIGRHVCFMPAGALGAENTAHPASCTLLKLPFES